MKILLVEDEEHKVSDLSKRIAAKKGSDAALCVAGSVRDAINQIVTGSYDLILLDMALPTFAKEKSAGETGGVAQASGGVEVIRMLQQLNVKSRVLIVTQYPDIYISGELIKSKKMKDTLRKKYDCNVIGVVNYSYESQDWIKTFDEILESLK